jgi:Protein of unknown function (DUF2934)
MQSDRQERISERAYQIWIAEGRIHGRHDEHWQRAEHEIAEEELKLAVALVERAAVTTKARRPRQATAAKKPGGTAAAKSRTTRTASTQPRSRRPPVRSPS